MSPGLTMTTQTIRFLRRGLRAAPAHAAPHRARARRGAIAPAAAQRARRQPRLAASSARRPRRAPRIGLPRHRAAAA
jgi:hypothetical protein